MFAVDRCGLSDDFRAGPFFIILGGPSFGEWRERGLFVEAEQLPTDARSVTSAEFGSQLLNQLVIFAFAESVGGVGLAVFESGQHEYSAGGSTRFAHTANAPTEGSRHFQRGIPIDTIQVCKSCHHRLCTVESAGKQLSCQIDPFFQLFPCVSRLR